MNIIGSIKPQGYDEWAKRASELVQNNPEAFQPGGKHSYARAGGQSFVVMNEKEDEDQEWETSDGTRSREERAKEIRLLKQKRPDSGDNIKWEPEPPLEASQYVTRF